jgi:hypothetical protein
MDIFIALGILFLGAMLFVILRKQFESVIAVWILVKGIKVGEL